MLSLWAGCGPAIDPATRAAYGRVRVPFEACAALGPSTVTPEAMRRDWNALEHILRRGYAGWVLHDEATWERTFSEGRAAIPDAPISATAWRDVLAARFAFADDNHLGFSVRTDEGRSFRSTSAHRFAHVSDAAFERIDGGFVDAEGRPIVSCAGQPAGAILHPVYDDAVRFRVVALSVDPIDEVTCVFRGDEGEVEAPLSVHRIERARDRGPAFERLSGPIPWLRVRSLGMAARGRLEQLVASAAELRDAPAIVLDLRGNGGGSDRFLLSFFAALTSQDLRFFDTRILTSEVELQGALTFWGCALAASGGDGEGRAWIEGRVAQAERLLERAMRERGVFREVREGTYVEPGRAPEPFEGRLVVLVDRGCGSACETGVMLARQIDGTIVVGENTEGTMKVGELRAYRLPETGVWVSAGRRVHIDPQLGGFPEGEGYQPDVWLDGGDLEAQVRAIAEGRVPPD